MAALADATFPEVDDDNFEVLIPSVVSPVLDWVVRVVSATLPVLGVLLVVMLLV